MINDKREKRLSDVLRCSYDANYVERELFPRQMIIESISVILKANNERTSHTQENE